MRTEHELFSLITLDQGLSSLSIISSIRPEVQRVTTYLFVILPRDNYCPGSLFGSLSRRFESHLFFITAICCVGHRRQKRMRKKRGLLRRNRALGCSDSPCPTRVLSSMRLALACCRTLLPTTASIALLLCYCAQTLIQQGTRANSVYGSKERAPPPLIFSAGNPKWR